MYWSNYSFLIMRSCPSVPCNTIHLSCQVRKKHFRFISPIIITIYLSLLYPFYHCLTNITGVLLTNIIHSVLCLGGCKDNQFCALHPNICYLPLLGDIQVPFMVIMSKCSQCCSKAASHLTSQMFVALHVINLILLIPTNTHTPPCV